ncbi:MAG: type III-B CRISPR-associated protein Cas10/Cmr2 [Verrucomicrobiota bacterium]
MKDFWKRKLAAYLHDPPSKCLDIRSHGDRSDAAFRQAGFLDTEVGDYFAHADHTGAAADRLPFPNSQAGGLSCVFDGVRNTFRHPLSGDPLPFHAEFPSVEQGFEGENSVQPALTPNSLARLPNEGEAWRARYFAHWRLWPKHATEKDYRLGLLPADTRIPDHTIWTHMQVVSALAGCLGQDKTWQPAFLKFQLGPVQEFIAAARSTRDLWSGSYLLSWLMAVGLKALSAEVGPDAVIFPSLRGQPLFDLMWRKELWDVAQIGDQTVWASIEPKDKDLLTPNLPNIFLALVSRDRAADLASLIEKAIRKELDLIADSVWDACEAAELTGSSPDSAFAGVDRHQRFERQVRQFLSVSWQITPWPSTIAEVRALTDPLPLAPDERGQTLRRRVLVLLEAATKLMPVEHRDRRYYTDDSKTELNNVGVTWALLGALNSWQLDAVRQTRQFDAWDVGACQVGAASNKDSLTGREEAVAGGRVWLEHCDKLAGRKDGFSRHPQHGALANRFKHDDWVGATTLIKRLWDLTYLKPKFGLEPLKMPNTRGIAVHEAFGDDEASDGEGEKYFAVLALDGDEIGKWVAGDKCPDFGSQLADYHDGSGNPEGARTYFERHLSQLLNTRRPVSPSYHLQFSESLSNFALLCARPIVEAFDGRLIYAGGDDVLAMLPADTALNCARALRMAFQGEADLKLWLQIHTGRLRRLHDAGPQRYPKAASPPYYQKMAAEGFLLDGAAPNAQGFVARLDMVDQQERPIPFLVPGPTADCSVGIAIAHFKAPLQDVVRAAQTAEKRAKKELGRRAVAMTLMKRSGETIDWGCQWESGGLEIYDAMLRAVDDGAVSKKFPHRVVELLAAYLTETTPMAAQSLEPLKEFPVIEIIVREFRHALDRQAQRKDADTFKRLADFAPEVKNGAPAGLLAHHLHHVRQCTALRRAVKLAAALDNRAGVESGTSQQCLEALARTFTEFSKREINPATRRDEEFRQLLAQIQTAQELPFGTQKCLKELVEAARKQFERELSDAAVAGLIGLCQTVAFTARNLTGAEAQSAHSPISRLPSESRDTAERQVVP